MFLWCLSVIQDENKKVKERERIGGGSRGISIFHKTSPNTKDALGCHLVTLKTKDQHFQRVPFVQALDEPAWPR